jgi:GT2 family glycosyltransferase
MGAYKNNHSTRLPALQAGSYPPTSPYDADIIILIRNRFTDTLAAVDSALAQQNIRFHVSVLDQGSDPDIQLKFVSAFKNHRDFGYYFVAGNLGVAGGRNFLSALGNGKIIIGLDNDAVFVDAFIAAGAVRAFDETPSLGALGFKILSEDGIHLDEFSWGYPAGLKPQSDAGFATTTFVGAGHAIRRTTWTHAGGYDADLFFTWEEYDFALRAIASGWSIRCDGSLAVIHKIAREARVQWSWERTRLFIRNRLALARKWNLSWAKLTPRICVYLLKAARDKRLTPAFAGLFAAIAQDHALFKRSMNSQMLSYIFQNETRFHESPLEYFHRQILRRPRRDPDDIKPERSGSESSLNHALRHIAPAIDSWTKPPAG